MVTLDNSSLASFLMACLVAPSHLGVPVVDAEKARRLGQSAKVREQLAAMMSGTIVIMRSNSGHVASYPSLWSGKIT